MARVKIVKERFDIPNEQLEEFDEIVRTLHVLPDPFSVLLRSPGLATKVMAAGAHIRLNSTLTMEERQTAIIALAHEKQEAYEWSIHVKIGRDVGVRDAVIEVVKAGLSVDALLPVEADIVLFVRQLLRTNRVADDLFGRLLDRHGERWLVELTATIGQYEYIAAIANVFNIGSDVAVSES